MAGEAAGGAGEVSTTKSSGCAGRVISTATILVAIFASVFQKTRGAVIPRVSLYVDESTHAHIRRAAKAAGMSLSRWVATVVAEKTTKQWPEEVLALAGTWKGFPSLDEIREGIAQDSPRETI